MQKALLEYNFELDAFDLPKTDICDIKSIQNILDEGGYKTIINCAAYTNVDRAESDLQNAQCGQCWKMRD